MNETAGPRNVPQETSEAPERRARGFADTGASSLLDTLHVGVVMLDIRGRVLLWSPVAEEILGWTADGIVGSHIDSLLRDPSGSSGHERPAGIYTALRRDQSWRGILHVRHRDGHEIELDSRASVLADGQGNPFIVASIAETRRLRAVEHDLAALEALFGSSPLGIALFDTQQRYVRVNEALAKLNNIPAAAHLGRTVHDTLPPAVAREIDLVQRGVLETGRSVVDLIMPAPDGIGARSVTYSRLTDDFGHVLGLSCAVMDVSERRDALEKIERARQRLALLDHVGVALGDLLDVSQISQALATALVPRFADYADVLLLGAFAYGGELPAGNPASGTPLLQFGVATREKGPAVERMLRFGQDIAFDTGAYFSEALATGEPCLIPTPEDLIAATPAGDPQVRAALDLGVHSVIAAPLRARGIVLGLLVISRHGASAPFDRDDVTLTADIAARAGTSLDNARLYAREREGALMLQRALLPQHVPSPPGVRVAYRYVPGSTGTEVGGDWFDVVALAGGRVAFVVGDVTGHGLRAAATMGRLRTAVRTLAGLDLPPDELLRRVNDLTDDLAASPDEPLLATCLYAVYDTSVRRCWIASAGHVPPLLLTPRPGGGWDGVALDLPSGAPIGVGGVAFESTELDLSEGSVLVLYTDGLIERRDEAITDGIERLRSLLSQQPDVPSLEDACDAVLSLLSPVGPAPPGDDAALLMAQLGGLPEGSAVSWTFSAGSYAVRRARMAVRETLREWDLNELADVTELLVSELVTNSLRYATGPVGVRMVRGGSLLIEVSDPLPGPPRLRTPTGEDESGRGIQLVAHESRRWGTRHGAMGKTVWFELALPG